MRPRVYFDGYNTLTVYARESGYSLVRYHPDRHYCGDRHRLYSVRTHGEDIDDFATLAEAKRYFRHCVETDRRLGDTMTGSQILDEIIRTWEGAA